MNIEKKPEKAAEIINLMHDYLARNPPESIEELVTDLKEEGIDTDKVLGNVQKMVAETQKKLRLSWVAKARDTMGQIQEFFQKCSIRTPETEEEFRASIKQLQLQPSFRNLKDISEEDWISIWEDCKRLELLDDES